MKMVGVSKAGRMLVTVGSSHADEWYPGRELILRTRSPSSLLGLAVLSQLQSPRGYHQFHDVTSQCPFQESALTIAIREIFS